MSKPKVKLLSGGNPQIPKGDGEEVVRAYLDAMPGWKRAVGERLDALIVAAVPDVEKVVRWNSPFYGRPSKGWFVSFHCFTNYVKVSFLQGSSLDPLPPIGSKDPDARYYHVEEDGDIDEERFKAWCVQAAKLEGWKP